MATASNSCGLSFERTVEIIKRNILTGNYNGRTEVMKGLMGDGFSYAEATEVTDYYYKIFRRVSSNTKQTTPGIILSAAQRKEKMMNNLAVDYLNGNTGGIPMGESDLAHLESIYEKAGKADTPTLKERYNEEANAFVQKFMPGYTNEAFKSSVYARPLLSAVFFIKSMTSNLHAIVERSIANTIWDGKRLDFRFLTRFAGLGNSAFFNVLKGGVPATNLYQSEQSSFGGSRLEEFSMKGTAADSSRAKKGYYGLMRFFTRWSNRLNSAPDTRGIFVNAERHYYQLLKEHYRELGHSGKESTQLAIQDMELDDQKTAEDMAEAKFKELGVPFRNRLGNFTSEANVAIAEYRRLGRDENMWSKAIQLSKNDFWKRNLTVASELGFGDYGIFGVKVQLLSTIRRKLEGKSKNKLSSAFNLYAFGFLNGAANFAEDALERMPLYGAIKIAALQYKKGRVGDYMLRNDIARRQKDIIVKNLATAAFFLTAKAAEDLLCSNKSKESSEEISGGFAQIGVCGIPVLVPPQMMSMYKVYNIINNNSKNNEEFTNTLIQLLPVLSQGNNMGLGGTVDKLSTNTVDYVAAKQKGDDVRAEEIKGKAIKNATRMAADMANSFLPLPSRATNEAATVAQRARGLSQAQQKLPFATDQAGNPLGFWNTVGKMSIANLGNVTGISEVMIAAFGSGKNYAVDWQGRKIAQFRGSDIVGSGIQYEAADDIIAEAGVKAPYLSRTSKIEVELEKENKIGFLPNKVESNVKTIRYMTDEEFFNTSVALGNFNKEYFVENGGEIVDTIKEDKPLARKQIQYVFDRTKASAIDAVASGLSSSEDILDYIKSNWETKRKMQTSETQTN